MERRYANRRCSWKTLLLRSYRFEWRTKEKVVVLSCSNEMNESIALWLKIAAKHRKILRAAREYFRRANQFRHKSKRGTISSWNKHIDKSSSWTKNSCGCRSSSLNRTWKSSGWCSLRFWRRKATLSFCNKQAFWNNLLGARKPSRL